MDQYPVARNCPECGSASYTRVKVERLIAFMDDRKCNECATRYIPPTPVWAAVVFIVVGFLLSGLGVFMIVRFMNMKQVNLECSCMGAVMLVLGGVAPLIYGIRSLAKRPSSEAVARTMPAPLSNTVQTVMYPSGSVLLLVGVLSGLAWLANTEGSARSGFPPWPIIYSIVMGAGLLSMPGQIQQQRDKRIKEYHASAHLGALPPVEIPRPPDVVFLGTMFGILAMFTVAVVFGPAAIACGIAALSKGHLKGLIGVALGVVSMIVWGLVFVYFFQGGAGRARHLSFRREVDRTTRPFRAILSNSARRQSPYFPSAVIVISRIGVCTKTTCQNRRVCALAAQGNQSIDRCERVTASGTL
jgi:hypothetical protein